MSRLADDTFPRVENVFDPPLYTVAALTFIQEHLGTPGGVARAKPGFPTAPDEAPSVLHALDRFSELEQRATSGQIEGWVGFDAVSKHISEWVERQERFLQHKHEDPQGKGFHPEMFKFDSRGKANWAGPGTSSGRVRKPLFLIDTATRKQVDFTKGIGDEEEVKEPVAEARFLRENCLFPNTNEDDPIASYVMCPVCEKHFEFDANSNSSETQAWGKLGRHLKAIQDPLTVDDHRLAHQEIFPT